MTEPLQLSPLLPADGPELASWFRSKAELVQWAGPAVAYPFNDRGLRVMLAEAGQSPARRLCRVARGPGRAGWRARSRSVSIASRAARC